MSTQHTQANSTAVPGMQEVSQAVLSVQCGLEHVCMRAVWMKGWNVTAASRPISNFQSLGPLVLFVLVWFSWWEIDFIEALYIKHLLSLCH